MPDRNRNERPPGEGEDRLMQRAVLAYLLHVFPTQMTRERLRCRGFGDLNRLEIAIRNLAVAGLVWCEGEVVLPTLPARHFDSLELP